MVMLLCLMVGSGSAVTLQSQSSPSEVIVTVTDSKNGNDTSRVELGVSAPVINGNQVQDTDGDGLWDELNDASPSNALDAQTLYANRGTLTDSGFDHNNDGVINALDAQALYNDVSR